LLLVAMMQRLVLRPLQALARVQEAMRDGAVPTPVAVRGSGEFAAMAASYNRLVADLSASESRLRTIFEAFPESVIVTRLADGIILDTNDAFLNKIGRSRAEVIGHTGQALGVLADNNDVMAHRETLLEKGSLERELIHLRTAQGEDRWSMYSSRLIDFDGVPAALIVSVDVTQLKLAETRIRQGEANFAALFQLAPVPMSFTPERDQYGHTHWNDAWYAAFGFLPEEAEGRGGDVLGIWVNPDERRQMIQGVLDTGHAHAFQVVLRRKDGALRQHILYADRIETGEGKAMIVAKMNSLLEPETIHALYEASQAGVSVELIIRGVCALRPGVPGLSENIRVRSIIGRFLEHHRIFYFLAGGKETVYLSSADWMERNFFKRIEVAFPILDPKVKRRVMKEGLRPYLGDNCQAWELDSDNHYRRKNPRSTRRAAQEILLKELTGSTGA